MSSKKQGSSRALKEKRRRERRSERQRRGEQLIPAAIYRGVSKTAADGGRSLPADAEAIFHRLVANYRRAHPDRDLEQWDANQVIDMFHHYFDGGGDLSPEDSTAIDDAHTCAVEFAKYAADRNPERWSPGDLDNVSSRLTGVVNRMASRS